MLKVKNMSICIALSLLSMNPLALAQSMSANSLPSGAQLTPQNFGDKDGKILPLTKEQSEIIKVAIQLNKK